MNAITSIIANILFPVLSGILYTIKVVLIERLIIISRIVYTATYIGVVIASIMLAENVYKGFKKYQQSLQHVIYQWDFFIPKN